MTCYYELNREILSDIFRIVGSVGKYFFSTLPPSSLYPLNFLFPLQTSTGTLSKQFSNMIKYQHFYLGLKTASASKERKKLIGRADFFTIIEGEQQREKVPSDL